MRFRFGELQLDDEEFTLSGPTGPVHVPLAIELAAGQLRRFDLDELSQRLDDRLALLSGRASGAHPLRRRGSGPG